jgi:hypothetical protein
MGDQAVEEAAWATFWHVLLLGFLDLAVQVACGLFVDVVMVGVVVVEVYWGLLASLTTVELDHTILVVH